MVGLVGAACPAATASAESPEEETGNSAKPMTTGGFFARIGSEFPRSGAPWAAMNAAEVMRWKTNAQRRRLAVSRMLLVLDRSGERAVDVIRARAPESAGCG